VQAHRTGIGAQVLSEGGVKRNPNTTVDLALYAAAMTLALVLGMTIIMDDCRHATETNVVPEQMDPPEGTP
jgi:hypothetical protein